jgi:hypothetical protein
VAVDPRLRALYLAAVAVGVFFLPGWKWCAGVAGLQVVLWLWLGLGIGALVRQLRKLVLLLSVIWLAYAFLGEDPEHDRWITLTVPLFGFDLDMNSTGALEGLAMILRIAGVVLASHVARAGDPRALAAGLGRLGLPRSAALAIDAVLALLGDGGGGGRGGGRGGGGGGGGGGGRHRHEGEEAAGGRVAGFWAGVKRLARGDVGLIVERLDRQVARAERHIASVDGDQRTSSAVAHDIAVVAGMALTMLGIKALKLLPGLPFAPGHKGVLLIPLYIAAGLMTRSRAGATLTGCTMGVVAFLMGDGRYGIFEIAKHIAPGVLVDLLLPIMRGRDPAAQHRRSVIAWSAFGLVVALGRFATVTLIAFAVQPPALVYALLLPGLIVHASFGALSGMVTAPLVRAIADRDTRRPPD